MRTANNVIPTILFALVIAVLISGVLYFTPVSAGDDIEDCVPIGKANQIVVFRCEDYDLGNVCYIYGGFLMCIQD